jgi:hypothetical protein
MHRLLGVVGGGIMTTSTVVDRRDDWRLHAACAGMDTAIFDLASILGTSIYRQAHQLCAGCPVKKQCRDMAVRTKSVGLIFGGADFGSPGRPRRTSGMQKTCGYCRAEFEAYTGRQRFCTADCRHDWEKARRGHA